MSSQTEKQINMCGANLYGCHMVDIKKMDKSPKGSELSEKDAERIGHKIKHEIAKRFLKKSRG